MDSRPPIAIVGIGGHFPGAATLAQFWDNIAARVDSSAEPPTGRWTLDPREAAADEPRPDGVLCTRGCFVELPPFDPRGLEIDADWLARLDPLYTLALSAAQTAFEESRTDTLDRGRIGVALASIALPTEGSSSLTREIVGRAFEQRLDRMVRRVRSDSTNSPLPRPPDASAALRRTAWNSRVTALPASIVASALRLGGGRYTLDAACASSLYAVKLACEELHAGRADAMLAGGVSRPDCLYTQMGFSQLRALSPTGRCRPFDTGADGLLVGEGAGVLLLKRIDDAIRDGDRIYALIRAVGWSNDVGGSLLAPDSEGQLRAMRSAYEAAGWSPDAVDLIECHGTGTPIGDAVELASLRALWSDAAARPGVCPIGSVKSNIGHLLTAAGAAGLIKVLLAMSRETLPPSANYRQAAAAMQLDASPFRVQPAAVNWPRRDERTPRRAAVSAFGFGGINAHLLLEEFGPTSAAVRRPVRATSRARVSPEPIAIVGLSARFGTADSLQAFQEACFKGVPAFRDLPPDRWRGADEVVSSESRIGHELPPRCGGFIESIEIEAGRFKLPPAEIREVLPQQLLMLQAADDALRDAGITGDAHRPRAGLAVGIGLDPCANDFHLRWALPAMARDWAVTMGWALPARAMEQWISKLRDALSPPLNAVRTLGALGGIVASRIAREFNFGGPSFTLSAEEVSGLTAVDLGVRALQRGELDLFLAGAVDLFGDLRSALCTRLIQADRSGAETDGEEAAPPIPPGEGAGAVLLKRLSDARRDGDRIYAVIRDIVQAGAPIHIAPIATTSAAAALRVARPAGDEKGDTRVDIGSADAVVGHCGCAAGIASLIRAALCLHHEILPGDEGPRYWFHNRADGPRQAALTATSIDGSSVGMTLEACEQPATTGRSAALGVRSPAAFVLEGRDPAALLKQLPALRDLAARLRERSMPIEAAARRWHKDRSTDASAALAAVLTVRDASHLQRAIDALRRHLTESPGHRCDGEEGVYFSPAPLGHGAPIAFVFPGSGNCFPGMGRELALNWPQLLRALDSETQHLANHLAPIERTADGEPRDPRGPLFAQVAFGVVMSDVLRRAGLHPAAVIGYSLGESAGLFALRAWRGRDEMYDRLRRSSLFGNDLNGAYQSARRALNLPADAPFDWSAVILPRDARTVRSALGRHKGVHLLIANTPDECVVGGPRPAVDRLIAAIGCGGVRLRDVPAVHCPLVRPVEKEYRELHLLRTTPPEGVRFYSAAWARAYDVTRERAAASITDQARDGFDFVALIRRAHRDGIRIFVEAGPQDSCTRMIGKILAGRPHLARSASRANVGEFESLLALAAALAAERVPIDWSAFYDDSFRAIGAEWPCTGLRGRPIVTVPIGGPAPQPVLPEFAHTVSAARAEPTDPADPEATPARLRPRSPRRGAAATTLVAAVEEPNATVQFASSRAPSHAASDLLVASHRDAAAHQEFLRFSAIAAQAVARTTEIRSRTLQLLAGRAATSVPLISDCTPQWQPASPVQLPPPAGAVDAFAPAIRTPARPSPPRRLSREECLEFARGSIARVLGPEFAEADGFPTRVRLPDEPLMLVDRITAIEGIPRSLGPGRVVTEHDVQPGDWYLDGGRMPVSITVESGQADLFLCAFLGIDLATRGRRVYRLLDAVVTFHRGLPRPGETVQYDIRIDRFVQQGEVRLFFFRFDATIGGRPVLTMRDGCAGFFTYEEIDASGGIVEGEREAGAMQEQEPDTSCPFHFAALGGPEAYDDTRVAALRAGDLPGCFGPAFADLPLSAPVRLPTGRLRLFDRVPRLDPRGGRRGLGMIRAEADIHPDDWFLTCHFVDDRVMPGTLMYECCAHALRFLLMRLGWLGEESRIAWEPLPDLPARLRCRGPVTPRTKKVTYEVQIARFGSKDGVPHVVADALMYADGRPIVRFTDMSMQMSGTVLTELQSLWRDSERNAPDEPRAAAPTVAFPDRLIGDAPIAPVSRPPIFNRDRILAFAVGNPSEAFGEPYRIFDSDRRIARLPGPPYQFLDRITAIHGCTPFQLAAGGWIEAQYDVPPDAWYFAANRQPAMPFSVILEAALQPCGWLAAYLGSALQSDEDLSFRNLGGRANLHEDLFADAGTLTTRVRMAQVSQAGGMIIQQFQFQMFRAENRTPGRSARSSSADPRASRARLVYEGETSFGFFSAAALARQVGIRDAATRRHVPTDEALRRAKPIDPAILAAPSLPEPTYRMIDRIETLLPDGGPRGLGWARATTAVDPAAWFFKAHFYQDPVWPGSLGLESFIQVLKVMALQRWRREKRTARRGSTGPRFEAIALGRPHEWWYRGQIIPTRKLVTVEAAVTEAADSPAPILVADGFLSVDGVTIYEMRDFGIRLIG